MVVVLYALLMGLALTQLGVSSWAEQRERFGKSVRIWGISLIAAPLLAALAISGPWALPVDGRRDHLAEPPEQHHVPQHRRRPAPTP